MVAHGPLVDCLWVSVVVGLASSIGGVISVGCHSAINSSKATFGGVAVGLVTLVMAVGISIWVTGHVRRWAREYVSIPSLV